MNATTAASVALDELLVLTNEQCGYVLAFIVSTIASKGTANAEDARQAVENAKREFPDD